MEQKNKKQKKTKSNFKSTNLESDPVRRYQYLEHRATREQNYSEGKTLKNYAEKGLSTIQYLNKYFCLFVP